MAGAETGSKQKVQFILPADLKFSSLVRRISEDIFLYAGFMKEWADRLKLVVDELFMNASRYGSKEGGKIYLSYSFDQAAVHFLIEDEGSGQPMTSEKLKKIIRKNAAEMEDLSKTCGRGLALFSHFWTDDMQVLDSSRGGIAISFTKNITAEVPPSLISVQESAPMPPQAPVTVMKILGQIDASNMEEKIRPVMETVDHIPSGNILTLDCSELLYINSTFIGYLVSWLNVLQKHGSYLVLRNLNPSVGDVLELVGLSKVIYMEK